MFTISFRKLFCFFLVWPIHLAFAQEGENPQQLNQAIFNKIEYHFNQQETDSIYALTSENFKKSLTKEAFNTVMTQQMYPLGQIQSAELISFDKNAGVYRLNFISTPLQLMLGLDSLHLVDLLLFQPYTAPAPAKVEPIASTNTLISKFDKFVDSVALDYTRKGNTHALAVGIINAGKTSSYYYGIKEKGIKQLPNEDTLFEIGSISKTFTATLLAYLVETQQVGLDDSITKYLPDSVATNVDLQRITLKQLANHTSGLPRLPPNLELTSSQHPLDPYAGYQQEQLYNYLMVYKAAVQPDSIYEYSNLGFGLLGAILSNVTGKSYHEMVQEIICHPLKLQHTTEFPDTSKHHFSKVYNNKGEETPSWNWDVLTAAGSLKSTVTDLLQYAKAHFKLPETDLENALALTRQYTFHNPPDTDIGLGWHTTMKGGYLIYQHTGGTFGSSSFMAFSPDKKIAVVMLSNTAEPIDSQAAAILDRILAEGNIHLIP